MKKLKKCSHFEIRLTSSARLPSEKKKKQQTTPGPSHGAMASRVSLGGSKFDSAFTSKIVPCISGNLVVEIKLPPQSGPEAVETHP